MLIEAAHHAERLARDYPGLKPEQLSAAMNADPTDGGYANWIVDRMLSGVIALPEDTEKVRALLWKFHRLKQSPRFTGDKNLYSYPTYGALARAVGHLETKGQEDKIAAQDGLVEVTRRGSLVLYKITTPQAAAAVAKNTHWCIKDPRFFEQYQRRGNLFVVTKGGAPYVAVHDQSQAMDYYDDPITPDVAAEIAPLFVGNVRINSVAFHPQAEQVNAERKDRLFSQVRERFVQERVKGYTAKGVHYPGVTRQEAEAMFDQETGMWRRGIEGTGHAHGFVNNGLINLARAMGAWF